MRLLALLGVFALAACKATGQSSAPGDGGQARAGGPEGPAGADPATAAAAGGKTGKQALPKVRDRDPEEERKKMALSRQRSAQAREFLRARRYSDAVTHSRQALKIHEQNVDAMLVLAHVYYGQKKYELTLAVTNSALAVDEKIRSPQDTSRAYNLKGFALVAMGKDSLATQAFKKSAENDDKNASAWNNLGTRYLASGDAKTALSCFQYALELKPNFANAHLNYGAALRAQGKWIESEKSFRKALSLRKNYAPAFFNLGVLYLDADPFPGLDTTKRLNRAIQYLTKYRDLATAASPGGGSSAGSRTGTAGTGPAVSRARADDYIRVAKKGLEREERRIERERKRVGKAAGQGDPGAGEPGPGARKPGATKPGATEPAPSKKPGAAKPAPSKPTPTKPGAGPKQPAPKKPAPSRPTPTKPGASPKQPAPTQPKPTRPTPKQPTQTPAPKKPGVQKPAPQKPGQKSARAWNPRRFADTKLGSPSVVPLSVLSVWIQGRPSRAAVPACIRLDKAHEEFA